MFKLSHNCTHFTCCQSNAQNSPSQASTVHEPWTSISSSQFRKGRGTRDQNANICWITKKAREFQNTSTSASLTTLKLLTMWITTIWKIPQEMGIPDHLPTSWEICMQVKKQQLQPDMEQQTGSKLGKEYIKAACCHPAYLTYVQSTWHEMPGWMKHKLKSRLLGEISITSDMQMTPTLWKKAKIN